MNYDKVFGNVMLVLILTFFIYLAVSRTYLYTQVAIVTPTGELMWMDEYYKSYTNQPIFLQEERLSAFENYNGSYIFIMNESTKQEIKGEYNEIN